MTTDKNSHLRDGGGCIGLPMPATLAGSWHRHYCIVTLRFPSVKSAPSVLGGRTYQW